MSARNCQELGINLQKVCSRLLANDELVKLLYHTDIDPFSQEALTDEDKKKKVFNNLICGSIFYSADFEFFGNVFYKFFTGKFIFKLSHS